MRAVAVLVSVLHLAACSAQAEDESEGGGPGRAARVTSPSSIGAESEDVGATQRALDPGALQLGDTVLGLEVVGVDVERVPGDSLWIGEIVFEGDLVVHGIYQRHRDWPVVEVPCVHVVRSNSIARVPRFMPSGNLAEAPRTWFCFENPELALQFLGIPEMAYEVVVVLDRYVVRRDVSDTFDTARLVELIEVGPIVAATLSTP